MKGPLTGRSVWPGFMIISLAFFVMSITAWAEPSDKEKLGHLSAALMRIETDADNSDAFERFFNILDGSACITLGIIAYIIDYDPYSTPALKGIFNGALIAFGAVEVGRGIYSLAVPSPFSAQPRQFFQMPESNSKEIKDKIVFGELILIKMQREALALRIFDIVSDAAISVFFFYKGFTDSAYWLIPAGMCLVEGFFYLIFEWAPEREAREYSKWKSGAEAASSEAKIPQVGFSFNAFSASFSVRFP